MDDSTMQALRGALVRATFFAMMSLGFGLALVPFIAAQYSETPGSTSGWRIDRTAPAAGDRQ